MLVSRLAIRRHFEIQSKTLDKRTQFTYLLRIGVIVHTIYHRFSLFALFNLAIICFHFSVFAFHFSYCRSHNAIGKQHKLFYQMVGIKRIMEEYLNGLIVLIQTEMYLRRFEVDCPLAKTISTQLLRQSIQHLQCLSQLSTVNCQL